MYRDNHVTLYNKDCRVMSEIKGDTIQCVVTSPPYWGLRKYAGEQELIWGGEPDCEHEWGNEFFGDTRAYGAGLGAWQQDATEKGRPHYKVSQGSVCSLCGAWRGAFGLEPTPEMYVQHTIEILREVRRVLRSDGVCFLNIGDSYMSSPSNQQGRGVNGSNAGSRGAFESIGRQKRLPSGSLKPKDLCLIPFRIALAAQSDGWWVRSVIIWSKPNPMPESVTDRPTESHEYILMLTKSARYYWDQDAVREPFNYPERTYSSDTSNHKTAKLKEQGNRSTVGLHDGRTQYGNPVLGRNIRSVWEFPTQPYPEAHFAVFPEKLPEMCIKAASKEDDLILDPFAGSGTTLWVAKKLNRKAVGYELSEEYCQLIVDRCRQQVLM